ncbi:putative ABC transporter permease subunit [Clostridium neuense]|uniref:ABC transporter permease subunit n=1 Tax=Clostridium neuense TaxID=1728934 RepID=A0ABW8TKU7_9CLOT
MKTNKFFVLTKYLMMGSDMRGGRKKKGLSDNSIYRTIMAIILFLLLACSVGALDLPIYESLKMINMQSLLLVLNYSLVAFVIFFFGVFYVMNIFYFSKDIDYLLPLPVKPETIIASKFVVTLLYEYFIAGIILVPCTIIYGINSSANPLFYVYSVILIIFLPVLPLCIALLLSILVMPLINLSKNKDLFKIIGGILALVFAFGFNIVANMGARNAGQMSNSLKNLSNSVGSIFPGGKIAAAALINSGSFYGFLQLVIFVLINILSFVIILVLSNALYFKGVVGLSESGSKRKAMNEAELSKAVARRSVVMSYTIKELKLLFRTPAYFINCVIIVLIWPLVIIMPMFFSSHQNNGPSKDQLISLFASSSNYPIIIAAAAAFGVFVGCMNVVTCTSISREGDNFFVMKYIPVPYKQQITAKILSGVAIALVGQILLVITAAIIMKMPIYMSILCIIIGLAGMFLSATIGILIDIMMPKLEWDNEQKAVKQNLNVLFAVIPALIVGVITVAAIVIVRPNFAITFMVLLVIYVVIDFVVYKAVCEKGTDILKDFEN